MKSYSSREIIKMLEQDGWYLVGVRGDHYYFKHHAKKGKLTVQHPLKDLRVENVRQILKQAGLLP